MGKKESAIQKKILDALNKIKGVYAFKKSATPWDRAGISDIIACFRGRFLAIEVKAPGGEPSALQEAFIAKIRACGGEAHVVRSIEDLEAVLDVISNV